MLVVNLGFSPLSSAKAFSDMTPTEVAKSDQYYNALRYCINGANASGSVQVSDFSEAYISAGDAKEGKWFKDGPNSLSVTMGYMLYGFGVVSENDQDNGTKCSNSTWIQDAATLWGYDSPLNLFCSFTGLTQDGGEGCTSGTSGFNFHESSSSNVLSRYLEAFQTTVRDKIGAEPATVTPAAEYARTRAVFYAACLGTRTPTPNNTAGGSGDRYYYDVQVVSSSPDTEGNYLINSTSFKADDNGKGKNESVRWYVGSHLDNGGSSTCAELATKMNDNAAAYSQWLKEHKDQAAKEARTVTDAPSTPAQSSQSCGSFVDGIGWIVCPVLNALSGFNDWMWNLLVENLLTVDPLTQTDDDGNPSTIYQVWQSMRTLANVLLIIMFLIVIYGQITGGMSNYNIKHMLPKIVLMAIAINLSFLIVSLLVDVFNVTGSSLYGLIKALAPQSAVPTWGDFVADIVAIGAAGGTVVLGIAAAGGIKAALLLALPTAVVALLGFLAALLTLIVRQALIPILAILAPLAFVAYVLPNTEQWFKKWWSMLISMLALYPMAALLFGGIQLAARIVAGDNTNPLSTLIALVMMGAPMFLLPFLARQTGPLLSKVNGALTGLAGRAKNPVGSFATPRADLARGQYLSQPLRYNRRGGLIMRDRMRASAQHFNRQARLRKAATNITETIQQREDAEALRASSGQALGSMLGATASHPAAQSTINAAVTRANQEAIKDAELSISSQSIGELGDKLKNALLSGDSITARAAQNVLYSRGGKGIQEVRDRVDTAGTAANTGVLNDMRANIVQNHGALKNSAADQMIWATSQKSMRQAGADPSTWELSDAELMQQNWRSQKLALQSGAISQEQAARILDDNRMSVQIDPNVRQLFEQARSGTIPPAPTPPAGPEPHSQDAKEKEMTTTTTTTTTRKKAPAAKRPLTWTGTEHTPRKRWWWWIGLGYTALLVILFLLAYQQWITVILTVVIVIALIQTYHSKPRTRTYTLTGTSLRINTATIDLTRYNRSVIDDPWTTSDGHTLPGTTILLLPKARLALPVGVILPDNPTQAANTLTALTTHIPLTDNDPYTTTLRTIDRIARWLRIS